MATREATKIAVVDQQGATRACIRIALLPSNTTNSLKTAPLIVEGDESDSSSIPAVQLLESYEYRYEFIKHEKISGRFTTDHADILQPDTENGYTGRLRPGLYTGTLPIRVFLDSQEIGTFTFEVRSRKLRYLDEYRWMVRDLAEQMSEIVMNRFAPAMQRFSTDETKDAKTLYQRFAFLKSLISGEDFQAAMSEVIRRPHVSWVDINEAIHPSKGLKSGSYVSRQLAKGGPRERWPRGILSTIPARIHRHRTEVTVDTTPNRFVKFAIEQWRDVVTRIRELLSDQPQNPVIERGLREVKETLNYLDGILAEGLFRELGVLDSFPADNQVLHKREGYRDIFRAYIQFDVAAKLAWDGGEDVYGAGKKDVATLYEYWVFMKLAQLVSELCDIPFEFSSLIKVEQDALNVALKVGKSCVLKGVVERQGRRMDVTLWFNRSFAKGGNPEGSWSRQMRPDFSLKISPAEGEKAGFEPIYVHFDAKYRIDHIGEIFKEDAAEDGAENQVTDSSLNIYAATAKRDDLLKMHAYRDAIRRSAGAYVLYPGTEQKEFREYHELLPGLGAFALRPSESGSADGKQPLVRFIEDILKHVASQISQHERGRYWIKEVYDKGDYYPIKTQSASFLSYPPADTRVLLGYVKNDKHWRWIEENKLYNLRGYGHRGTVSLESKELHAEFIILSDQTNNRSRIARVIDSPQLHSKEEMRRAGYPNPRGIYFCFCMEFVTDEYWSYFCDSELIERVRSLYIKNKGPVVLSWLDLIKKMEMDRKN